MHFVVCSTHRKKSIIFLPNTHKKRSIPPLSLSPIHSHGPALQLNRFLSPSIACILRCLAPDLSATSLVASPQTESARFLVCSWERAPRNLWQVSAQLLLNLPRLLPSS